MPNGDPFAASTASSEPSIERTPFQGTFLGSGVTCFSLETLMYAWATLKPAEGTLIRGGAILKDHSSLVILRDGEGTLWAVGSC